MSSTAVVMVAAVGAVACCCLVGVLLLNAGKKGRKGTPSPSQPPSQASQPSESQQPSQSSVEVSGPLTGKTWTVSATYYGPDKIHGIHGGNDNIFEHIPAGQYTAAQLRKIGKHFCAMTEKFLRKGFMGKVLRIKGSKATMDFVVVDLLPDRNDGKGVEIDIHDQADWLALGGDASVGIQKVTFSVAGKASIPVSPYSPWQPQKFGFT